MHILTEPLFLVIICRFRNLPLVVFQSSSFTFNSGKGLEATETLAACNNSVSNIRQYTNIMNIRLNDD